MRRRDIVFPGAQDRDGSMRATSGFILTAMLVWLAACERGGASTREVREAAIDRARDELQLADNVPIEARVWVGEPLDDDMVVCGTVSSKGDGQAMQPKRFAATTEPIRWLVFEDAHDAMIRSQPDKFYEWAQLCPTGR